MGVGGMKREGECLVFGVVLVWVGDGREEGCGWVEVEVARGGRDEGGGGGVAGGRSGGRAAMWFVIVFIVIGGRVDWAQLAPLPV